MEKRNIQKNKWNRLLVLIILYCSESLMLRELLSASVRAGIIIAFITLYMVLKKKLIFKLEKKMLVILMVLLFCIALSGAINGFEFVFDFWVVLMLFLAVVICSIIDYYDFWIAYVDVMVALGFISAVIFILYQLVPRAFFMFSNYIWHGNILMKNCFICALQVDTHFRRNFGVFYEPGMFSVFLVLALYFSLFRLKFDIKKTAALLVALATTLSTNGYICAVGLIMAFLLKKGLPKRARDEIILLSAIGLLVVVIFLSNNTSAFHFLVDKLTEINFKKSVSPSISGSGNERWRSVVYAWGAFLSNPIVGIGYVGWCHVFNSIIATATTINWFGIYGIIYGLLMNYFYLKNSIVYMHCVCGGGNVNYISTVILGFVFVANIMSQSMTSNLIILILIFYQMSKKLDTNGARI